MTKSDPPEGLQEALARWAADRARHAERLSGREAKPAAGDLYALPCHAWASPTWLVVEDEPDGTVRMAPGDDRPWANTGDLWVGEEALCLRLASCVRLRGELLPAGQRVGVLPDAPGEVLEHEQAARFVRAPMRDEDEDQQAWRTMVARAARILPRFLADGVVELRLSEFRTAGGAGSGGAASGSRDSTARRRMAADSASPRAAFLRAVEQDEEALLVDELDCDCGGSLQLIASRRGLGLLFTSEGRRVSPPTVLVMDDTDSARGWRTDAESQATTSRIFFPHDWRAGVLALRIDLPTALVVHVVDDVWFT